MRSITVGDGNATTLSSLTCAGMARQSPRHSTIMGTSSAEKNGWMANARIAENYKGCWLWLGEINRNGYGTFKVKGRRKMAHRAMYEAHIGPIPGGLVLDHRCRCRRCCNPLHMEPVTSRENTLRGEAVLFTRG